MHKIKTEGGQFRIVMSNEEYQAEESQSAGVCLACGELTYGVEPDAHEYRCEDCREDKGLRTGGSASLGRHHDR